MPHILFQMATFEDLANANMSDFIKALQENHLAQVTAAKYETNPLLLGEHFALNFTPLPSGSCGDDPAENSEVILVSFKPDYKSPTFGNILNPKDKKGKKICEISRFLSLITLLRLVATIFLPLPNHGMGRSGIGGLILAVTRW